MDRPNLSEPKKVENLQNKVISSLRDHVTYNPDAQRKGSQYFSRILDRLPVLRTLSSDGCQKLFYLKVESQYPVSPILEKIMMSNLPFWHYYHSATPFKFWSTSKRPLRRTKCKQTQRKKRALVWWRLLSNLMFLLLVTYLALKNNHNQSMEMKIPPFLYETVHNGKSLLQILISI